ncbi:hypothetical protein BCM02_109223 [Paenibacillus methanolicus]|uniref:Uncharacterized protein n=2 Tax=Paenibacillus methanolicus TaxID=582686 RepID=A0A5S5BY54_9BACL|nr:hypothetical protein BCM02_109223 [Paenibacillus methanolicus]
MKWGLRMEELGKRIDQLSNKLTNMRWEIWTKYTLFTWQWWMLVLACAGMVVLFVVLVRRGNLLKSFAFLGMIYLFNKNLDDVATAMNWYDYRMQLEPIIPTMLPANLFIIPGALTILYERYSDWKSYSIAIGAFAVLVSYMALPLMKQVKIYTDNAWNGHWSLLSLVAMAAISKLVVDWFVRQQSRESNEHRDPHEREIHVLYTSPSLFSRRKGSVK